MNITQSLSSLSSQQSNSSSSSLGSLINSPMQQQQQSSFASSNVNDYSPLMVSSLVSCFNENISSPFTNSFEHYTTNQQQQYQSLEQKMHMQLQLQKANFLAARNATTSNAIQPCPHEPQTSRRPITGFNNFSLKNNSNNYKLKPITANANATMATHAPSFTVSPNLKFSRKVFVGGLPPDIDESKKLNIKRRKYLIFVLR